MSLFLFLSACFVVFHHLTHSETSRDKARSSEGLFLLGATVIGPFAAEEEEESEMLEEKTCISMRERQ